MKLEKAVKYVKLLTDEEVNILVGGLEKLDYYNKEYWTAVVNHLYIDEKNFEVMRLNHTRLTPNDEVRVKLYAWYIAFKQDSDKYE